MIKKYHVLRDQAQTESLRRQDTNTKNKKNQLNNQNYTNQNSHSKNSFPVSLSGGQVQNIEILSVLIYIEETMKTLTNFGEQLKNQFHINATLQEI